MAQLWGGRFTKQTDQLVYNFNQSIGFDQKFFHQDVRGSRAHVQMLAKQQILTEAERDQILGGLDSIEKDVDCWAGCTKMSCMSTTVCPSPTARTRPIIRSSS